MNAADLTQTPLADDGSFEVLLQKSGQTLQVSKDQSILAALQDAGLDVPYSCSQGVCGTCQTPVAASGLWMPAASRARWVRAIASGACSRL